MKNLAVILAVSLLPIACGQVETLQKNLEAQTMSSEDQAANQLYLDDVTDSAAESETSSSTEVDSSVETDVKSDRLDQMASMLMSELDADASGSLSLEEFLVGPGKRADDTDLDDETKAKIEAKMTEDFNAHAGDDALLSSDELKTLLKDAAPRVGRHRHHKFPGQQDERIKEGQKEVLSTYDTDGDGVLNQSEFDAMIELKKADCDQFRAEIGIGGGIGIGRRGPGAPGPKGQGPGAPKSTSNESESDEG